jgi:hypothetical protein
MKEYKGYWARVEFDESIDAFVVGRSRRREKT